MEGIDRYTAQALCTNCTYQGPISPLVGTHVTSEPCPICRTKMLYPATSDTAQKVLAFLQDREEKA